MIHKMSDFAVLHNLAHQTGITAGNDAMPRPMIVGSPSTPFDNGLDPTKPQYYVPDGVCGFAWVHMKANIGFARWLKKQGLGHKGYPNGWDLWVSAFGQSMQRKEAYARAYANVLSGAGIDAYPDSRMD